MKQVVVGIADLRLVKSPGTLITYGLGSCLAIVLYCDKTGVGSMAHVMLPLAYSDMPLPNPGKFADTAVAAMIDRMSETGIAIDQLVAKLAGGAEMFSGLYRGPGRRIGARNILSAKRALEAHGVPLAGEDVGGNAGRTVELLTETGLLRVRTLGGKVREL